MGWRSTYRKENRGIGVTVRHVETMQANFGPRKLRPLLSLAWNASIGPIVATLRPAVRPRAAMIVPSADRFEFITAFSLPDSRIPSNRSMKLMSG
jgi:hypothetical protein